MQALLKIDRLTVSYGETSILKDISLELERGKILGLVGESGCGKSTLLRTVLRLSLAKVSGNVAFDGTDLLAATPEEMRRLRGNRLAAVFQNPSSSLNPTRKIRSQFLEMLQSHGSVCKKEAETSILAMLHKLNLPDGERILKSYPFELSGGMNQRVALALAMILQPELLLADEPTSALDVIAQAQVIGEMIKLREELGTSIILVTHSMGVIERMADRVGVMYAGRLVEFGSTRQVIVRPCHPYTKALIRAIPSMNGEAPRGILGSPPAFGEPVVGCSFAPRCPQSNPACLKDEPKRIEVNKNHWVACQNLKSKSI